METLTQTVLGTLSTDAGRYLLLAVVGICVFAFFSIMLLARLKWIACETRKTRSEIAAVKAELAKLREVVHYDRSTIPPDTERNPASETE